MPRRWRDRATTAAAALLLTAHVVGQAAPAPVAYTAPDGSRFLLVADPSASVVHWAVASPIDAAFDPAGHEGLAWTIARASLHGTWRIGSHDVAREQESLLWLDEAWLRMLRDPRDTVAAEDVRRWDEQARELCDKRAWLRALAAAPAWQPQIVARDGAAVLSLTTTRDALPAVARLLVERREDQALRDLPRGWLETFQERGRAHIADAMRGVRIELLALTLPGHPSARAFEPPNPAPPSREQAAKAWAATQAPGRAVHVLVGDLDVAETRTALAAAFARSDLVAPPAPTVPSPRPLAGTRRSQVTGVSAPLVALAWPLPAQLDGDTAATTAQWLAGDDGEIVRRLRAAGRATARVAVTAPWPAAVDGRTLLMLEATDPAGIDGLADALVAVCAALAAAAPTDADLARTHDVRLRAWRAANPDARSAAATAAVTHLAWPAQDFRFGAPRPPAAAAVQACLQQVFRAPAAIVEARP